MSTSLCPCGSGKTYAACCQPYHDGAAAPTAEATMRARYAAFALAKIDYLCDTLPVKERKSFDRKGVTEWATGSEWKKLEIHKTEGGQAGDDKGVVEFTATFVNGGNEVNHREKSIFQLDKGEGRWVLVKSVTNEPVRAEALPGRNEPCHCGSGKKFKKCHGAAA